MSVVLPAFHEAENLKLLLPRISQVLASLEIEAEVLVVDGQACTDGSKAICDPLGARYVNRCGGDNYGHAIRTGISESRGDRVVIMDADGSHDPEFLRQFWEHRNEADLIIASRYMKGGHTENVAVLVFMSLIVNVVFRLVLGLKCADVSNSFRLYRAADLKALTLRCDHFDIVEEILVNLAFSRKNFSILEIPCTFHQRKEGKTKRKLLLFAVGYVFTLARLLNLKLRVQHQPRS